MNAQWREIQQTVSRQSHTEIVRQLKQMAAEITKLSNDIDETMVEPCLFPPDPGMAVHYNACFSFIQILRYHFNIWCSQMDSHSGIKTAWTLVYRTHMFIPYTLWYVGFMSLITFI